jgi:hypothetical protein
MTVGLLYILKMGIGARKEINAPRRLMVNVSTKPTARWQLTPVGKYGISVISMYLQSNPEAANGDFAIKGIAELAVARRLP